jgi:hypothetical protein
MRKKDNSLEDLPSLSGRDERLEAELVGEDCYGIKKQANQKFVTNLSVETVSCWCPEENYYISEQKSNDSNLRSQPMSTRIRLLFVPQKHC